MSNPAPKPSLIPHFGDLQNWTVATFFALGRRAVANGNVYQVTTQGTSAGAGTGPSGTGGAIADNTIVWAFQAAVSTAWTALTGYTRGDVVSNDGGKLYIALNTATSAASGGPTGTVSPIADDSMVWAYESTVLGQQTTPTARVGDAGAVPGAPAFAQYENWWKAGILAWIYYVRDLADEAFTWTGLHVFNNKLTANGAGGGDTDTAIECDATPSAHFELLKAKISSGYYFRIILEPTDESVSLTINALWNGSAWAHDTAGASYRLKLRRGGSSSGFAVQYYSTAGTWAEGAWVNSVFQSNADSSWTAAGGLIATVGGVLASAGNIIATLGDIVASAGNITATLGDIQASVGKLIAGATRSSGTAGAGQGVPLGTMYKDTAPVAWAQVNSGGGLVRGANISAVTKNGGSGNYSVDLVNGVTMSGQLVAVANTYQSPGIVYVSQGTTGVTVQVKDTGGSDADIGFNIVFFGGG